MTTLFIDPPILSAGGSCAGVIDAAPPQAVPADVSMSAGRARFKKLVEDQAFVEAVMERSDGSLRSGAFVRQVESVPTGLDRVVTMMRPVIGGVACVLRQIKNVPVVPCADMWFPDLLLAELQKRQTSRGAVADGIVGACE